MVSCINNETVKIVECVEYLRLTLDNKLNFDQNTTDIHKLTHITHHAFKITGLSTSNLSDLNSKAIIRRAHSIAHKPSHPLNSSFTLLPPSCRYKSLACRRACYRPGDLSLLPWHDLTKDPVKCHELRAMWMGYVWKNMCCTGCLFSWSKRGV